MKCRWFVIAVFWITGCGGLDLPELPSLLEHQPQVVTIAPEQGASGFSGKTVELAFNQPLAAETIDRQTMPVVILEKDPTDLATLEKEIAGEKIATIAGTYEVLEEGKKVRFQAEADFPPAAKIGILVTSGLLSVDRFPFNQTPGKGPTPFFSSFLVAGKTVANDGTISEKPKTGAATSADQGTVTPAVPRPSKLILNEIFYDAEGKDTEGNLFIELFGDVAGNLSGYSVLVVRASDGAVLDTLKIPENSVTNPNGFFVIADSPTGVSGTTNVIGADLVQNFDPPNTAGSIQLVDPDGKLVDVLGYGSPVVLRGENGLFCYETAPVPTVASGQSLTRNAGTDTNDNAKDWIINEKPTPGKL